MEEPHGPTVCLNHLERAQLKDIKQFTHLFGEGAPLSGEPILPLSLPGLILSTIAVVLTSELGKISVVFTSELGQRFLVKKKEAADNERAVNYLNNIFLKLQKEVDW